MDATNGLILTDLLFNNITDKHLREFDITREKLKRIINGLPDDTKKRVHCIHSEGIDALEDIFSIINSNK